MLRKCIYTVITGNYDRLQPAPNFPGWDTVLFTDQDVPQKMGWTVRSVYYLDNPVLESRRIKILSHQFLSNYDLVCYVDANQKLLKPPPSKPVWFHHVRRKTIFEEARQLIINGRFPEDEVNKMMSHYINNDYQDCGLYLNGYFIRRHTPEINLLHDIWFEETERFLPRDQLTLPYAIFRTGIFPENRIFDLRIKESYAIVKKPHVKKYDSTSYNSGPIR